MAYAQKVSFLELKSCSARTVSNVVPGRYYTLEDLTLNFPTFSKPLLNLDFYINTDPGARVNIGVKYSGK